MRTSQLFMANELVRENAQKYLDAVKGQMGAEQVHGMYAVIMATAKDGRPLTLMCPCFASPGWINTTTILIGIEELTKLGIQVAHKGLTQ